MKLSNLWTALLCMVAGLIIDGRAAAAGTWTTLTHPAPDSICEMLLLTDGTVMCQGPGTAAWYKLTPDNNGSYANGIWTTLAPMTYSRRYYSAQVLRDGTVFVAGAEYGTGGPTAEIYDPVANVWTTLPTAPGVNNFVDSISESLPNGDVLIAPVTPDNFGGTVIWHATAKTWALGPPLYRGDDQDEASWVKLPDQSILTIDPFTVNTERYIPSLNQWINDAIVPTPMYGWGGELGAGFLLPNGKAFFIGGTNHTAIYTPSGTTSPGVWTAGATIPNNLGAIDAPAAMMVNGNILCALGTDTGFGSTIYLYEYNYQLNTFALVSAPGGGSSVSGSPYGTTMLDLPDGTVLYSGFGSTLYDYTPSGSPVTNGVPTILSVTTNLDGSLLVSGTVFNGISEGAAYGDDSQMATDYPLGRITNSLGNVQYCRTYNWSVYNPMTGTNIVSTYLTLPPGLLADTYPLVIVANGIGSPPYMMTTAGTPLAAIAGLSFTTVASNQIAFEWNSIGSTETGYVIQRSTDGTNYSTIATVSALTTSYTDNNVSPLGQYYYTVMGTNSVGLGLPANIFVASPPIEALSAPWNAQDIGPVMGAGASGTNINGFTVIGAGTGCTTSNDQFQVALQPIAGDMTLTAHIATSQASSTNAFAGVMVRDNFSDAVASVAMGYDAGSQTTVFEYRAKNNNAPTLSFSAPGISLPVWVQLVRTGNTFTGYTSTDGSNWTPQGTILIVFPTVLQAGLAVSSGVSNLLNSSTFDNVNITGIVATSPVAWSEWKLNETSGTVAIDSRAGNNGMYENTTLGLPGATPALGYSAGFNGVNAAVALPPSNLNTTTLTITLWMKRTADEPESAGIFFDRSSSSASGLNFCNTPGNQLGYTWNNSPSTYNWQSGLVVPSNVWTFVALTITPSNAVAYLATNGVLFAATNEVANNPYPFNDTAYIGQDNATANRYFIGQLNDVQFFNQSLTAAQLTSLASPPVISLASPTNGTSLTTLSPLTVTLSSANGHVLNAVQYFTDNGQLLGESTTPPYSTEVTNNLNIGTYVVFARLLYDSGYFVDSPLDSVTVFVQPSTTNHWDAAGSLTGASDGNGNWGAAPINWWNGSTAVAWTDDSVAVFGAGVAGSYTVAITNPITPYSVTFNTGNTYTLTGTNPILLNIPGTPLAITANGNATISAPLQGSGSLLKLGTGTLTLTASNSYSGATLVNAGTLKLANNAAFGSSANVTGPGTLDLDGQDFTASMFNAPVSIANASGTALTNSASTRALLQDVVLSSNAILAGTGDIFIGGTNTVNGILNLNGFTLTKSGNDTLILNGLTLTGAGNIVVGSGTLQLMDVYGNNQQDTLLNASGNLVVNSGASIMTYRWSPALAVTMPLVMNGGTFGSGFPGPNGTTYACPVIVSNNSTFNFGGGYGTCTFSGNITGTGGLTISGDNNARTFTGTNSYGWTLINNGYLNIGNGGNSGTLGLGKVTNVATLLFNRANSYAVSNLITGSGSLIQSGPGIVTLLATNTYTGTTMVTGGSLFVNGAIAGSTTTVGKTATLGGTGSIGGPVTVQLGATLQPGNNGIGRLNFKSLVLAGQTVMEISSSAGVPTNDVAFVTNGLTEGGILVVTNIGANIYTNGETFKLFSAASYSGAFTNITLPVLPAGMTWITNQLASKGSIIAGPLKLVYTAGANGTISGVTPQFVNYGASGTHVSAAAHSGYYLANWSDGSTSNPRTDVNVTSNINVTAIFGGLPGLVTATPVLNHSQQLNGNQIQFSFSGTNGQTYRVISTTNLLQPMNNWSTVTNGIFGNDMSSFTNAVTPDSSAEFYRIVSP